MKPPSLSSQVAEIELEGSTLRRLREMGGVLRLLLRLRSFTSWKATAELCGSLCVKRARDGRGNEQGHPLSDLPFMHYLGDRICVQVPRKRNNVITPALAASTMNLPVVLAEGI